MSRVIKWIATQVEFIISSKSHAPTRVIIASAF